LNKRQRLHSVHVASGCRQLEIVNLGAGAAAMSRSDKEQGSPSLEHIALFNGLAPDTLLRIQQHCVWHRYDPGEPVVNYLETSSEVYFIASGEVHVRIYSLEGKAVTFCDLTAGEMFGEVAAIDNAPRSASIEARTSCLIASMPGGAFRRLLETEPALALALLQYFAAKIRTLTTRVYEVSALAVANRIQAELLRLAKQVPQKGKCASIASAPTHAEMASRISTHREAVTRELNRLSRIGIIERRGTNLVVKDIDRLIAMVHEATGE
jgi:CRP-like cAMP-binding protein